MAGLVPIPNTRISDLFVRQRLTQQFQTDQLDLFRLQDQISTGQRIILPSDDAPAALRAITLQRLLERKDQLQVNVQTGQSFLAATDTALNDIAQSLGDIRGATLGVAGTTTSPQERNAVINEVNRALEQLVQTGNRKFRGRFLFSGSQTSTQPYSLEGTFVKYLGNEKQVNSHSDLNVLFATSSPGTSVFGGISKAVEGSVDLNPQVSADTLLSSLRGGRGISPNGAIQVSDGSVSSTVDISSASTLGDVARFIEENPPAGRQVTVTITGQGLTLQLTDGSPGNLTVTEVGSGASARELGILEESGVLTAPLVGSDLDPVLLKTSLLGDLLGAKAIAKITSSGPNNDIRIEAASNGAQFNGATVQFVDNDLLQAGAGVTAGSEFVEYDTSARAAQAALTFDGGNNDLILQANTAGTSFNDVRIDVTSTASGGVPTASYDSVGKVLTINLESDGTSDANQVIAAIAGLAGNPFTATLDTSVELANDGTGAIAAINQSGFGNTGNSGGAAGTLYIHIEPGASTANQVVAAIDAEGTFIATLDAFDTDSALQAGTGLVALAATATTSGGSGAPLDKNSGIQIVNGSETFTLDFTSAKTVEDLLNILNGSEAGLLAELNAQGTGINVRSRFSGSDFQIGENGGQTATQLGIRTYTTNTKLNDLNYGNGVTAGVFTPLDGGSVTGPSEDITITARDGTSFDVDLRSAKTIGDVLDLINTDAGNVGLATAQLATTGNGIVLVDTSGGVGDLVVTKFEGSQAAEQLGLIAEGQTENRSSTGSIQSTDRNYLETDSVFNTLIRLRDALQADDLEAIERAIAKIDADIDRVSFARADVGARQQGIDLAKNNLQDEEVQLRFALSDEIDVDLVEAISAFTARQVSLEASLRATANILQLSLLNFL